jgi:hypothetical protein
VENRDTPLPAHGAPAPPSATIDLGPVFAPLAAMVADRVGRDLLAAESGAAHDPLPRLLRTQEEAARASGLAETEFKKRLREGSAPANYTGASKRPSSYDSQVLRLWALHAYPPFDRERPAEWITWLYAQFGMTPAGTRLST